MNAMLPESYDTVQLTLRAEGPGAPLPIRLRHFLKDALRAHGLQCVEVIAIPSAQPDNQDKESKLCD